LLFAQSFPFKQTGVDELEVLGVDISPKAVQLAQLNRNLLLQQETRYGSIATHAKTAKTLKNAKFLQADVLKDSPAISSLVSELSHLDRAKWDVLISNPPYISPRSFWRTTSRSVRSFEPRLALVPPHQHELATDEMIGDSFYPRLLQIARLVESKVLLLEVADLGQAERVAYIAQAERWWDGVEIWRDDPHTLKSPEYSSIDGVKIIGQGNCRSVICWRNEGRAWLGKASNQGV
jgi:methylase of polypeptide subunit release factors